jgi:hypothetical protein
LPAIFLPLTHLRILHPENPYFYEYPAPKRTGIIITDPERG